METTIFGFKKRVSIPFKEFSTPDPLLSLKEPSVWPLLEQIKIKGYVPYKKNQTPSNVISEGAIIISPQNILQIPYVSNQAEVVHKRKKRHGSTAVATSSLFMAELKMTKQSNKLPKQKKTTLKKQLFSENDTDSESSEIDPPLKDNSSFDLDDQNSQHGDNVNLRL